MHHRHSQPLDPIFEENESSAKPSLESSATAPHPPRISSSVSSDSSRRASWDANGHPANGTPPSPSSPSSPLAPPLSPSPPLPPIPPLHALSSSLIDPASPNSSSSTVTTTKPSSRTTSTSSSATSPPSALPLVTPMVTNTILASPPPSVAAVHNLEHPCRVKFAEMVRAVHDIQQNPLTTAQTPQKSSARVIHHDNHTLLLSWRSPHGDVTEYEYRGNLQYIPPEMFSQESDGQGASDVWVLGISLYRMLVGAYPFKGDTTHVVRKMAQADFSIPDHLSHDAKDLLRRMLAPKSSRASMDLVLFHPWLKALHASADVGTDDRAIHARQTRFLKRMSMSDPPAGLDLPPTPRVEKKRHSLSHWMLILCQGPFPTKPYQELVYLGTRQRA
ncbi:kinase-like domain-containing protein [Gongronella butleri]|nr:kinase-like domain-containing protein [Gongronella butleri]